MSYSGTFGILNHTYLNPSSSAATDLNEDLGGVSQYTISSTTTIKGKRRIQKKKSINEHED